MKEDKYTNNEIYLIIKSLKDKIKEGFDGTYKRLDITNGKIDKHETRINKIETWKSKLIGAFIITNLIFLPVIVALLVKYL